MSGTNASSVIAGVVDGTGSIVQHLEDLGKNPNDAVAFAQVTADFENTTAALTALVPGLGASAAFVALSADFNLIIQRIISGKAYEIGKSDIIPIVGNLVTLFGQAIEVLGVAGTPITGGLSLVLGETVGEAVAGLGALINLYGLSGDLKEVRATLGMLADSLGSSQNTSDIVLPPVIVTAPRITVVSSEMTGDGNTLIEHFSDQSIRYTTVSPDGTSVTKLYKEIDDHISLTQVQVYTDATRSTLLSNTESSFDSVANQTTVTTVNYNSNSTNGTCTFSTQVIDNTNSDAVKGSVNGVISQNGSILNATVDGVGVKINANDANVTLSQSANASVTGTGNIISFEIGASAEISSTSGTLVENSGTVGVRSMAFKDQTCPIYVTTDSAGQATIDLGANQNGIDQTLTIAQDGIAYFSVGGNQIYQTIGPATVSLDNGNVNLSYVNITGATVTATVNTINDHIDIGTTPSPPPVTFSPPPVTFSPPPVTFSPPPVTFSPPPVTFSPPPVTFSPPSFTFGSYFPLVLSLDGQGANLTDLSQSNAYFDYENTGTPLHTGWVGADTGLLVYLPTGTDTVTNGTQLIHNFGELAAVDINQDGLINSQDDAYSHLQVWADSNGDGLNQSGELHSLASLGIQSIAVTPTPVQWAVGTNFITEVGTVTFTNGSVEAIDDATFTALVPMPASIAPSGQNAQSSQPVSTVAQGFDMQSQSNANAVTFAAGGTVSAQDRGNTVNVSNSGITVAVDGSASVSGDPSIEVPVESNNRLIAGTGNTIAISGQNNQISTADSVLTVQPRSSAILAADSNNSIAVGSGNDIDRITTTNGGGNNPILSTAASVQLWFQESGNDLSISVLGNSEQITVKNWFADGALNQITASNDLSISATSVNQLVQAMAAFTPPTSSHVEYSAAEKVTLTPVLASSWH